MSWFGSAYDDSFSSDASWLENEIELNILCGDRGEVCSFFRSKSSERGFDVVNARRQLNQFVIPIAVRNDRAFNFRRSQRRRDRRAGNHRAILICYLSVRRL